MPTGAALANDKRARGHIPLNSPTAVVENLAHSQKHPHALATLGSGIVVVEQIMRAVCPNSRQTRSWRAWHALARGGPFRNEVADRLQKKLRRLKLGHVRAARNDFQSRVRQGGGQFARHWRRRRFVVFAY